MIPGKFGQLVLDQIKDFPGLNYEAVIRAVGCTSNERYLIWERDD